MSNDLISRSALIERVSGKQYELSNVPREISEMLNDLIIYIVKDILTNIKNQKTAYNVAEVVKQLKINSGDYFSETRRGRLVNINAIETEIALDIVKAGGVNE